jgi:hypothetical protein
MKLKVNKEKYKISCEYQNYPIIAEHEKENKKYVRYSLSQF